MFRVVCSCASACLRLFVCWVCLFGWLVEVLDGWLIGWPVARLVCLGVGSYVCCVLPPPLSREFRFALSRFPWKKMKTKHILYHELRVWRAVLFARFAEQRCEIRGSKKEI